ncbi:MAG: hypothetical protein IT195_13050 [Microthrixaceae bacterium]|nr:hypothetical protein [Microthrixaceae bacterium]
MSASQPRVGIDFEALVRRATTDDKHAALHHLTGLQLAHRPAGVALETR